MSYYDRSVDRSNLKSRLILATSADGGVTWSREELSAGHLAPAR